MKHYNSNKVKYVFWALRPMLISVVYAFLIFSLFEWGIALRSYHLVIYGVLIIPWIIHILSRIFHPVGLVLEKSEIRLEYLFKSDKLISLKEILLITEEENSSISVVRPWVHSLKISTKGPKIYWLDRRWVDTMDSLKQISKSGEIKYYGGSDMIQPTKMSFEFNKKLMTKYVLFCTSMLVLGWWIWYIAPNQEKFGVAFVRGFAIFCSLCFLPFLYFFIRMLFLHGPAIVINESGIEDNTSLAPVRTIEWSDISSFSVLESGQKKSILVQVWEPQKFLEQVSGSRKKRLLSIFKAHDTPVQINLTLVEATAENILENIYRYKPEMKNSPDTHPKAP